MTVLALASILVLAGASGGGWERPAVRAIVAAGTSDLGGLGEFQPAMLGGGDAAGRAGLIVEGWWTARVAFGLRLVIASDTGALPDARTYFYRRALVAETVVTASALRAGSVDLVVSGGVGIAAITEGADRFYLLDVPGRWGEPMLAQRNRLGPTASIASGLLVSAGRLSLSALVRCETIGGRDRVDGTLAAGTLDTWGLALTGELGAGLVWR